MVGNPYAAYQKFATPGTKRNENNESTNVKDTSTPLTSIKTANYSKLTNNYQSNSVLTAPPEELTLMLYDGAIKFMNKAITYMESREIEKINSALVRAQDIFYELMNSLDMKYDISKNLYSLYEYINYNLMNANIKKDSSIVKEMIAFTKELRDTWAEAIKKAKKSS